MSEGEWTVKSGKRGKKKAIQIDESKLKRVGKGGYVLIVVCVLVFFGLSCFFLTLLFNGITILILINKNL